MDHDPIEDIVTNDEEDDGIQGYGVDHYWIEREEANFYSFMAELERYIQEEKQYGHIWEAADAYYEELDRLEDEVNATPNDSMARLQFEMKAAEQFGCEKDKSFAYEGLDILSQESVDDNFGDGDPSQWDY